MAIQVQSKSEKGQVIFYYQPDSAPQALAEMTGQERGAGELVIDHTFVDPSLRGQGIADQLMQAAADYARQQQRKIVPVCSYARRKMEKEEQYRDLW